MSAGYGACLINKPELVKDMVRHVRNQVDNPNYTASIKIRYKKKQKNPNLNLFDIILGLN